MLKLVEQRPQEKAPSAFPAAARANRTIFFSGASKTRKDATVLEVQTRINTMIEKCVGRYAALVDRNLASTQVSSLDAKAVGTQPSAGACTRLAHREPRESR